MLRSFQDIMPEVGTILGYIFIPPVWTFFAVLSTYFMYQLINYLTSKPSNMQTLLDGIYIQMFWAWILEMNTFVFSLIVFELDIKDHLVLTSLANTLNVAVFVTTLYTLGSCICRLIMIAYPHWIEEIPDNNILNYSK